MSQPIYRTPALKTILASEMPGYAPTDPKWMPTTITYQISRTSTPSNPVYVSPTPFTPQLQRTRQLLEVNSHYKSPLFNPHFQRTSKLLEVDSNYKSPTLEPVTYLQAANQHTLIGSDKIALYVNYENNRQFHGLKRKGYDGSNSVSNIVAAKRQCSMVEIPRCEAYENAALKSLLERLDLAVRKAKSAADVENHPANAVDSPVMTLAIRKKKVEDEAAPADPAVEGIENMMERLGIKQKRGWAYLKEDEVDIPEAKPSFNFDLPVRELRGLRSVLETKGIVEAKWGTGVVDIFAANEVPANRARNCKKAVSYKI